MRDAWRAAVSALARSLGVLTDDRHPHEPRWTRGERLEHLFDAVADARPEATAVDAADGPVSFGALRDRAAGLAGRLHAAGVGPGERVGLLLDDSVSAYAGMLAVLKARAAYVPLDVGFPDDRIAYICADAGVAALLVTAGTEVRVPAGVPAIRADLTAPAPDAPPPPAADDVTDDVAYVIYTSGTTGRPKGVVVEHRAICNFVRVAAEVYGVRPDDRVYQGMTLAFDFSVEELWVPWMVGATVVPRPGGPPLVGDELQAFLVRRGVTALCCVPTLLATLDEQALPDVRFLLVSGEACPQDLVERWHADGRRFLNVYGPTEATVTATWTPVHPGRPVTLGRPLPTYTAVVLDPDAARLVAPGELGEIGIAGIGLARGYLGRADLTDGAFIADFLELDHNPGGRIYRTGDLGRVTTGGELEFHGRIDTQVKLRGYRVELTEIESVLLGHPGIAQAVVEPWDAGDGAAELVAYYSQRPGADVAPEALRERLADRLPAYMVPAFYERLEAVPLTTSDKADRRRLPPPSAPRLVRAVSYVAPATDLERTLATAVADVLGLGTASVEADVFDDLGGSSLSMATFCARARRDGLRISIGEVYRARTVRALASAIATRPEPTGPAPEVVRPPHRPGRVATVLTGTAQLGLFAGYAFAIALAMEAGYDAVDAGGALSHGLRALLVGLVGFTLLALVPVAAKWLLIGRWREEELPVYGVRYLRFWLVKTLLRSSVMLLFAGSPLFSLYLRALGARVGRRAIVLTRHMPIATDLIELGDDVVVRKDARLQGYRAEGGRIRTGRVVVGARGFVGEASVLDVDTRIGADAQLAHSSSLHPGQRVPTGQSWHGSPARAAAPGADFRRIDVAPRRRPRLVPALAGLLQIAVAVAGLASALLVGSATFALASAPLGLQEIVPGPVLLLAEAAVGAGLLLAGGVLGGLLLATVAGRLAERWLRPGAQYPLHGPRHALLRALTLLSNRPFLVRLLGDSDAAPAYMGGVGWDVRGLRRTGSNFGTTHKHEVPGLCTVGDGTMISDGLSMANAEYSSTHFRLGDARIGGRNFLGNKVVFPTGARTGDNVLLATKVMVPIHGETHADTGLLGSPAFAIPRRTDPQEAPEPEPDLLRAKLRHNVRSMAALLVSSWGLLTLLSVLGLAAALLHDALGVAAYALATVVALPVAASWCVVAERLALVGHRLGRDRRSIYDPWFWRHERLWKLLHPLLPAFDGTPLKPLLLRGLGVRVGRRLFDDGAAMPEHSLVTLGDDCTLNAGSTIQCHSLEDGWFKSDVTTVGDGCSLGVGAFVHYGVTLAAGTAVDADSFLMKGSITERASRWRGNPAVALT